MDLIEKYLGEEVSPEQLRHRKEMQKKREQQRPTKAVTGYRMSPADRAKKQKERDEKRRKGGVSTGKRVRKF